MNKLIVFTALLACAAAAPGLVSPYAAPYPYASAYGAPLAAPLTAPWGHGLVGSPYLGAPVVKTVAPVPVATSYANTVRIASPAVVAAHGPVLAAPAYAHAW